MTFHESVKNKKSDIYLLLICFLSAGLLAIAQAWGQRILVYGALLLFMGLFVFVKSEKHFLLLLFFLPWSAILKPYPTSISFFSLVPLISLFKLVFFEKLKIKQNHFISVLLLFVVTIIGKLIQGHSISMSYIQFFVLLVYVPALVYTMKNKISYVSSVLFYAFGVIAATLVSLVFMHNTNLLVYMRIINQEYIGIKRLCGLNPDPNFFAAQVVGAIAGVLIIFNKSQLRRWMCITIVIVLAGCGLISISKSFILCLGVLFLVWLFIFVSEQRGHGGVFTTLFALASVLVIVLASGVFDEQIKEFLIRFGTVQDSSSLTTGRSDIWLQYLKYFLDNPLVVLFGHGCSPTLVGVDRASHNTIIQAIYQFGIMGTLILFIFIIFFIKQLRNNRKIPLKYYIISLVGYFSMWMGLDMIAIEDFFLIIALFALAIKYIGEYFEKNTTKNI